MAKNSAIEWTDHTWSPVWGCTEVSKAETGGGGCDNCYARTLAHRFGYGWNGAPMREFGESHWHVPPRWNARAAADGVRARVFPSMCDPFDKNWPLGVRGMFLDLIEATPSLDWLLLTKRVGNVPGMVRASWLEPGGWPANVWIGATFVNQLEVDRDMAKLLALPAPVLFASLEPLLGPIDLRCVTWHTTGDPWDNNRWHLNLDALCGFRATSQNGGVKGRALGWVIAGGESGPHARPAHPDWFRSLRDQCAVAGVPYLFKQWGEWRPPMEGEPAMGRGQRVPAFIVAPNDGAVRCFENEAAGAGGAAMLRLGKKAAGRLLDGIEHNGFPQPEGAP